MDLLLALQYIIGLTVSMGIAVYFMMLLDETDMLDVPNLERDKKK